MSRFHCSLFISSLLLLAPSAWAENQFSVGVEGFRDVYNETDVTVNTHSDYGAITAGYTHIQNGFFSAIDGRYSKGNADYKSLSGTLDNTEEIETDLRVRTGVVMKMWHGILMPYLGLGWRWYFDEGKGLQSSTGALAYDRRISQYYIPIGATYRYQSGAWIIAPTIEFDPMFYGTVKSRLGATGLDDNIRNEQKNGWGLRSEFMVGRQYRSFSVEVGPFVRYWHIPDSNCVTTPNSSPFCYVEPNNTRLQYGAALRVNF